MKKESSPLQVLFGLGLLILAATAPTQIVLASQVTPPSWVALVSTSATALAGFGALRAAYFSSEQARQVALSRKADYLVPIANDLIALVSKLERGTRYCVRTSWLLNQLGEEDVAKWKEHPNDLSEDIEQQTVEVIETSELLQGRIGDAIDARDWSHRAGADMLAIARAGRWADDSAQVAGYVAAEGSEAVELGW